MWLQASKSSHGVFFLQILLELMDSTYSKGVLHHQGVKYLSVSLVPHWVEIRKLATYKKEDPQIQCLKVLG